MQSQTFKTVNTKKTQIIKQQTFQEITERTYYVQTVDDHGAF